MAYTYPYPRPAVTADVVPLAWRAGRLAVLLVRRGRPPFLGMWAMPGGFLDEHEQAEACARRELAEETGIRHVRLDFLSAYDRPDRDPRGRTITLAYVGLVAPCQEAAAGDDAAETAWHDPLTPPDLAFDHSEMLSDALALLRDRAAHSALLFSLLPPRFALAEAHALYQAVMGRPIPQRSFEASLRHTGILARCGRSATYRVRRDAEARIGRRLWAIPVS
jgi:8-oxo-dGTP diphosphatase